ncbi:hypothetical protein CW751_03445 [Brumimicrobium salinarum]|uniref:tRNA (Guanine-N1)-methyltransferase n=2 Tax=Brumimicrobium salinarum TaxID=2058658 RepID=A0A2I0R4S4_9FLAO|nr:hypothetical protein CW751_03445 [Brumimicrobium salinarum]
MTHSKLIYSILAIFIFTVVSAQEQTSITDQFEKVIESSNSYQNFKVIKKTDMNTLQKNVVDSINLLESKINKDKTTIEEQKAAIAERSSTIQSLETELNETRKKVESIEVLGIQTHKTAYNSIMWSIIIVLFLLAVILFLVFKKGNNRTKLAKSKLLETENELQEVRKKALEKEQILRRELQDEINKNSSRRDPN